MPQYLADYIKGQAENNFRFLSEPRGLSHCGFFLAGLGASPGCFFLNRRNRGLSPCG